MPNSKNYIGFFLVSINVSDECGDKYKIHYFRNGKMRTLLAEIFRLLFKVDFFRKRHFGVHTKIIKPLGLFKGVTRKINYKGFKIELQIEDWIQENIYFLGDYEKAELQVLNRMLKPGDVFVDVGANFGLYSINAARIVEKNGQILSFEPFSESFDALKRNIVNNNISQITLENFAVGEKRVY